MIVCHVFLNRSIFNAQNVLVYTVNVLHFIQLTITYFVIYYSMLDLRSCQVYPLETKLLILFLLLSGELYTNQTFNYRVQTSTTGE